MKSIKNIFILSAFLTAGCAVRKTQSLAPLLSYQAVRSLHIGHAEERDALKILGAPTVRIVEANQIVLKYDDFKSESQRLTLYFNALTTKLQGLLWIPVEHEPEYSLADAKKGFQDADFAEIVESHRNPHMIDLASVTYVAEKSGVSILTNTNRMFVDAISIYAPGDRKPAKTEITERLPYTFSDDVKSK